MMAAEAEAAVAPHLPHAFHSLSRQHPDDAAAAEEEEEEGEGESMGE